MAGGDRQAEQADEDLGVFSGRCIGNYELHERVGLGGMGEVYRATQRNLGRTVALKILHKDLDSDFVDRFLGEARNAGRLNHPNVVQVHELGEEDGLFFFSMEFVPGGTVYDRISNGRCLPPRRVIDIGIEAARALEYAEKVGIVHCDVKPENLMIGEDGQVLLADLGVAMRLHQGKAQDQGGSVYGSPHYISPEQARGKALDHRTDLYSLGVTLYRLLAGRTPFVGEDTQRVAEQHVFDDPPPLRELQPDVPADLARIIHRLMEKDLKKRHQTASELISDLTDLKTRLFASSSSHKAGASKRKKRRGRDGHARAAGSKRRRRATSTGSSGSNSAVIVVVVLLALLLAMAWLLNS